MNPTQKKHIIRKGVTTDFQTAFFALRYA